MKWEGICTVEIGSYLGIDAFVKTEAVWENKSRTVYDHQNRGLVKKLKRIILA